MRRKTLAQMRSDARKIYYAGIKGVDAALAVRRHCKLRGKHLFVGNSKYDLSRYEHVYVVGAGKASARMALGLEEILKGRITQGLVITKYGHLADLKTVRIHEAGHPVPDEQGLKGAREVVRLTQRAGKKDLVFALISGGGSALLSLHAPGLTLKEKQKTTEALLACGANIRQINTVRKHISSVKGGQLACAAYPATLVSLAISDVVGDDIGSIASGPTVPDASTYQDALDILKRYALTSKIPPSVVAHIEKGVKGKLPETPKSGDVVFKRTKNLIVARNMDCLLASERKAKALGYRTLLLSSFIEGEARDVALVHAAIAKEVIKSGKPLSPPACIISGGETTVTLRGKGLGGRNQEFALAFGLALSGWQNILVLSAGTDGTDGPTDSAGAYADGSTVKRGRKMGLEAADYLSNNDSYHFFERLGDLFKTGPTNTNVMDLRIMVVA